MTSLPIIEDDAGQVLMTKKDNYTHARKKASWMSGIVFVLSFPNEYTLKRGFRCDFRFEKGGGCVCLSHQLRNQAQESSAPHYLNTPHVLDVFNPSGEIQRNSEFLFEEVVFLISKWPKCKV